MLMVCERPLMWTVEGVKNLNFLVDVINGWPLR